MCILFKQTYLRLFNLVAQYGFVKKISFSGDGDVCRVVMASSGAANNLQKIIFNQEIYGEFIQVKLAEVGQEDFDPQEYDLDDGSRSWKNYENTEQRRACPEGSCSPSKVYQLKNKRSF